MGIRVGFSFLIIILCSFATIKFNTNVIYYTFDVCMHFYITKIQEIHIQGLSDKKKTYTGSK